MRHWWVFIIFTERKKYLYMYNNLLKFGQIGKLVADPDPRNQTTFDYKQLVLDED